MRISFSMDGIKNFDLLYTYTLEHGLGFGEARAEHYHGDEYCKGVMTDVLNTLVSSDWKECNYRGSHDRIANETFILISASGDEYSVAFAVNTYNGKMSRLETTIIAPKTESYDHKLEKLKIALKDRLLTDWCQCTWLADEQAATLCKDIYEKTFLIENDLRAFASKVLIHFLGVDWIRKAGLEKESESVDALKEKFVQRVSEFDNINTDFLSMTLETMVRIMFKGVVYRDEIILNRQDYTKIQNIRDKAKTPANDIVDYIKKIRTADKHIWNDLFAPYIDDQSAFEIAIHSFIDDRNHVAHSKVLSWSAYQIMLQDFSKMRALISAADSKFELDETAYEMIQTWEAEQESAEAEQEYYRYRLASETGIDILDEKEIQNLFNESLHDLFNSVYQRYHLDVCYEISDFSTREERGVVFTVSCPAVESDDGRINIVAHSIIDDDLGSNSTCNIVAKHGNGSKICEAEIRFHNGNGYENEEGIMKATDISEYGISELDGFQDELFIAIESLNPYPKELEMLSYENKGAVQFVADFPCVQCGKFGISINETFLAIGKCCYCGYENELEKCTRCGELVDVDILDNGLCPSCFDYIDKQ